MRRIGPLVCPFLDEAGSPYAPQTIWGREVPCAMSLTRRATRHLIEGLHALKGAIDTETAPVIPVSADLCGAVADLCGRGAGDFADFQVQWSPAVRRNTGCVSHVRFRAKDATAIRAMAGTQAEKPESKSRKEGMEQARAKA